MLMVSLDKEGIELLRVRIANVHYSVHNLLVYIDHLKLPSFLTRFNIYTILQGQPVPIGILALLSDCLNFELTELICERAKINNTKIDQEIENEYQKVLENALELANSDQKKEIISLCFKLLEKNRPWYISKTVSIISKATDSKNVVSNVGGYNKDDYSGFIAYGYSQMGIQKQRELTNFIFNYESSVNFQFASKLNIALSLESVDLLKMKIVNNYNSVPIFSKYIQKKYVNLTGKIELILQQNFVSYQIINILFLELNIDFASLVNTGFETKLFGHKQYLNSLQLNYLKHFTCVNSWKIIDIIKIMNFVLRNIDN